MIRNYLRERSFKEADLLARFYNLRSKETNEFDSYMSECYARVPCCESYHL